MNICVNSLFNTTSLIKLKNKSQKLISFSGGHDAFIKSEKVPYGTGEERYDDDFQKKNSIANLMSDRQLETYYYLEAVMGTFLNFISGAGLQAAFKCPKDYPLDKWLNALHKKSPKQGQRIKDILEFCGIKYVKEVESAAKLYNQNKKLRDSFDKQSVEYFYILSFLEKKKDIANFPELLLYIFNEETSLKTNSRYDILPVYMSFLEGFGINNEDEIVEKIDHLKDDFNNLDTVGDRFDAINYLIGTYGEKLKLIETVLDEFNIEKSESENFYSKNMDIVDYLYELNAGKSLKPLSKLFDIVQNSHRINKETENATTLLDYDLTSPKDKLAFYEMLYENGLTIPDFNKISKTSIVSDSNLQSIVDNSKEVIKVIQEISDRNEKASKDFYTKHFALLNAAYENNDEGYSDLKTLVDFLDKNKITYQKDFMPFFNKAYKVKKGNISSKELIDFLKILKFDYTNNIFNNPKSVGKGTIASILESEKSRFEKLKPKIESFIENDESEYFSGQSVFDIYKKYRKSLPTDDVELIRTLKTIISLNVKTSVDYEKKLENIKKFEHFFTDKKDLHQFLLDNNVKFTDLPEDENYRELCLKVLNSLYSDKQDSKDKIKALSESRFLLKSKVVLEEFVGATRNNERKLKGILELCIKKQVPSVQALQSYIQKYNSINEDASLSLIKYLDNLPDHISFNDLTKGLSNIQKNLNQANIPISITAETMQNISDEDLIYFNTENVRIKPEFINKLLKIDENENFITALSDTFKKKDILYSKYRIANELAINYEKTAESYQNIFKLLNLRKEDIKTEDISGPQQHTKAIENLLPQKFVDFVNSEEWVKLSNDEKIPNLSLHAKLRIIDRFALKNATDIEDLYSKDTLEMLSNYFNCIYNVKPVKINKDNRGKIVIDSTVGNDIIQSVFSKTGIMITSVKRKY